MNFINALILLTLEILTNEKKYYNKFEKILRIILFEKHIFKKHFFFFNRH